MFFERKRFPQDYVTDQTFLSGLLTGVVTGLAIGFLFAPRSGKDLRKQIAGTVTDQTKEVQNQWDKTKNQAKETVDNVKTNTSRLADKAENKANEVADDLKAGVDQAKGKLNIG